MKYNKIVLAGGNGYLGSVLADHYKNIADEVIILGRHPNQQMKMLKPWYGMASRKATG